MRNMGKTVFIISCFMLVAALIASLAGILTTGSHTRLGLIPDIVLAATGNTTSPGPISTNSTSSPAPPPSPDPGIKTPRIVTGEAADIAVFEFTLNGELIDLGGASTAIVFFEWWRITDDIRTTDRQEMTSPGPFPIHSVRDDMTVASSTLYHFRAVAEVGGNTYFGEEKTFTTRSAVTTADASEITSTGVILNCILANIDIPNEIAISFDWGTDTNYGQTTDSQFTSSGGLFQGKISGLNPDTAYHFRAKVWLSGEKTDYGEDKTFTTLPVGSSSTPEPTLIPEPTLSPTTVPSPQPSLSVGPIPSDTATSPPPNSPETTHLSPSASTSSLPGNSQSPQIVGGDIKIIIINTDTFISNTSLEINIHNIVQNNIQLKTKDEKAILFIPEQTHVQNSDGKAPEALKATVLASPTDTPSDITIVQSYEFGPAEVSFYPAVNLTLKYDDQSLPSGSAENNLTIAAWDGNGWLFLQSDVDPLAGTVSARISHLGQYALIVPVFESPALNSANPSLSPPQATLTKSATAQAPLSSLSREPSHESPMSSPEAPPENSSLPIIWIVLGVVAIIGISVAVTIYTRNSRRPPE
jgi:hypothetical protein